VIENAKSDVWIPRTSSGMKRESILNLVNLLLRESAHRVTTIEMRGYKEPDPELYVVTRIDWRDHERPILGQLPRILSLLETLRGTMSVPREIFLDSNEGVAVYIPTGVRISQIPEQPKDAVSFITTLIEDSLNFILSTMEEVEEYFWRAAKKKGFSLEIVDKIGSNDPQFYKFEHIVRFHEIMASYFSIRFRIHTSESCLRVEA
jgi:hypothetical protein